MEKKDEITSSFLLANDGKIEIASLFVPHQTFIALIERHV